MSDIGQAPSCGGGLGVDVVVKASRLDGFCHGTALNHNTHTYSWKCLITAVEVDIVHVEG